VTDLRDLIRRRGDAGIDLTLARSTSQRQAAIDREDRIRPSRTPRSTA